MASSITAAALLVPAAISRRGCIISILNTPFFCHKLSTRTILLCLNKKYVSIFKAIFLRSWTQGSVRILSHSTFMRHEDQQQTFISMYFQVFQTKLLSWHSKTSRIRKTCINSRSTSYLTDIRKHKYNLKRVLLIAYKNDILKKPFIFILSIDTNHNIDYTQKFFSTMPDE